MARRHYKGNAAVTRLTSGIGAGDTSFTINDPTGWPTGGANGPFSVILDPDVPGKEEHVLVANQAAGSCTGVTRAYGDTSATTHSAGVDGTVIHGVTKNDYDEANRHIFDTAQDDHTQYLNSARHAAIVHTSAMLGTDSVGTDEIQANAVTALELANDAVDTGAILNLAVTAAKIANDTITATQIANLAIGTAEIADLAVTAAKIANDTITATQLAANAVGASELATGAVSATADIVDSIITLAKFASEAGTVWASGNPFTNLTLGAGGVTYARHFKLGRLCVAFVGFQLGTGGDLASPGLAITLPFTAASVSGFGGSDASVGGFCAARAFDNSTSNRVSGTGVLSTTECLNFVAAFSSSVWNFANPFDWSTAGAGSKFQAVIVYETT